MRCHARNQMLLLLWCGDCCCCWSDGIVPIQPILQSIRVTQCGWIDSVSHGYGSTANDHVDGLSCCCGATQNESLRELSQSLTIADMSTGTFQIIRRPARCPIHCDAAIFLPAGGVVVVARSSTTHTTAGHSLAR